MPQTQLLELLYATLSRQSQDLDAVVGRLTEASQGDGTETTQAIVALGFLACVKAVRETSLMQEVAIREEIQEIHDLGKDLLNALQRAEAIVAGTVAEPG